MEAIETKNVKTLNVKKTSNEELEKKWGFYPILSGVIYIRCNSDGEVNWDKAPVYSASELVGRNNVNIL